MVKGLGFGVWGSEEGVQNLNPFKTPSEARTKPSKFHEAKINAEQGCLRLCGEAEHDFVAQEGHRVRQLPSLFRV